MSTAHVRVWDCGVHLLIGRRVASSLWHKFARAVVCSTRARSGEHVGFREFHAHASCVWFLWMSELDDRSEKGSASPWRRFTLRLHLCHFESLQAVIKPSAFVATSDLHSGWKPGAEHVQQLIARAPTLGATDPLEKRSRVRALSAEERELEAAAVDLERLEDEDENYFGFFGLCSRVRHCEPCAEAEQQRASIATGATAFARQAGSRCATLRLPADDPCGTRHHSRWRHHLCAVCGPRDAQLPPSRQAEAEATTWSVSEMAVTCWHRCRGAQREAWHRPACSGCQQLDEPAPYSGHPLGT